MTSILHDKNIKHFLKNIDNPSAFDFTKIKEEKLTTLLSETPNDQTTIHNGTMQGFNRFCPQITYNCPETRRNAYFADSLKMEFELRELIRTNPSLGTLLTQTQRDIFQALLLNSNVFVNSFNLNERIMSLFIYLKVHLNKVGVLGNNKVFVAVITERKSRKKILNIAKAIGVYGHVKVICLDKSGKFYEIVSKEIIQESNITQDIMVFY